jgi:hypothetical protein
MNWIPLLLADPSPSLRQLVLRDLLTQAENGTEIQELKESQSSDPILTRFLDLQNENGSFRSGEGGGGSLGDIRKTAQALMGLGYLGLGPGHPAVQRGVEFLFTQQLLDGSFPLVFQGALLDGGQVDADTKYHMIPLQTALPLLGVAMAGCATDPRAEKAYEWLLNEELAQGGWPTGRHKDQYVFSAGYRRLAHSKFGCRTNTTAVVSTLAHHPTRRSGASAQRGLDLLLAHETRAANAVGFEVARIIGTEPTRGGFTYFKRYDVAQILDLSWRIGASATDERVAANIEFIRDLQGPYGLWEYPRYPEATRWVSFDILRSLSRLDTETDWTSTVPRIKFQAYPKKGRRF